jgi:hypothetical protein
MQAAGTLVVGSDVVQFCVQFPCQFAISAVSEGKHCYLWSSRQKLAGNYL